MCVIYLNIFTPLLKQHHAHSICSSLFYNLAQLRFSNRNKMSSFVHRIVFGLLVLCVFHSFLAEARFKFLPNLSSTNILRQRQSSLPQISRAIESNRQQPLHARGSSANSMQTIHLHSSDSSTSDIYRSASSPTLNRAHSPAIMRDVESLHRQAASSLNLRAINAHRENTLLQRFRPSSERMSLVAKYLKNSAIAAAGTGGVLALADTFQSSRSEKGGSNDDHIFINNIATTTTTTKAPEHDNPLGVDK